MTNKQRSIIEEQIRCCRCACHLERMFGECEEWRFGPTLQSLAGCAFCKDSIATALSTTPSRRVATAMFMVPKCILSLLATRKGGRRQAVGGRRQAVGGRRCGDECIQDRRQSLHFLAFTKMIGVGTQHIYVVVSVLQKIRFFGSPLINQHGHRSLRSRLYSTTTPQ
jgi:hypothetical protein